MYNFMLVLHVIVVISLIGAILIQRGRSGGLVEALGGVESIFGTKTSALLVRVTVGLVVAFFTTSISLAYISKQRGKSLLEKYKDTPAQEAPIQGEASSTDEKE
ncbi:MAG: preprotein translocase subunit SecG [Candidatus Omnitrophica bacterium]|nr:preprotein translocase subunit SecG [Candidatus Omnitrophota bacterium]